MIIIEIFIFRLKKVNQNEKKFLILTLSLEAFVSKAQDTIPNTPENRALIVFIRPADMASALDNWNLMADDNEFCRLSNNRYVTYTSNPGTVKFSSKRGGLGIGKPKDLLEVELEAGKTYYV